jgi:hypothetical protein
MWNSQRNKVQLSVILVWTWRRIILIYLTAANDGYGTQAHFGLREVSMRIHHFIIKKRLRPIKTRSQKRPLPIVQLRIRGVHCHCLRQLGEGLRMT